MLYSKQKRSAHWPKAVQVIDGEFSPPQHDVILSVLVSSGGRLAITATAVLRTCAPTRMCFFNYRSVIWCSCSSGSMVERIADDPNGLL